MYNAQQTDKNFCFNGSAALKVLSSAMDLAEFMFIRSPLKGEVRKFSEKSARTSSCESPLKIPGISYSCWQVGS